MYRCAVGSAETYDASTSKPPTAPRFGTGVTEPDCASAAGASAAGASALRARFAADSPFDPLDEARRRFLSSRSFASSFRRSSSTWRCSAAFSSASFSSACCRARLRWKSVSICSSPRSAAELFGFARMRGMRVPASSGCSLIISISCGVMPAPGMPSSALFCACACGCSACIAASVMGSMPGGRFGSVRTSAPLFCIGSSAGGAAAGATDDLLFTSTGSPMMSAPFRRRACFASDSHSNTMLQIASGPRPSRCTISSMAPNFVNMPDRCSSFISSATLLTYTVRPSFMPNVIIDMMCVSVSMKYRYCSF
eukprot:Rhum_TRINITY_DN12287_c0_g2::Rhum_TRINITY_DN12287_c0_g2_i1::g.50714::m.50714